MLDEAEIVRFLDTVQRLPELTDLTGLNFAAKPGILTAGPKGLF